MLEPAPRRESETHRSKSGQPGDLHSQTFFKPIKICGGSRCNWESDELRHIVGVHAFHSRVQLREMFARSLNQQQTFARGLDLPLPAINGVDSSRKYIHASGQIRLHHGARDSPRFCGSGARHQNHKFVGQEFLQARYSFSFPSYPKWSPVACHATILRRRPKILFAIGSSPARRIVARN
jgi:hypothetical protein